MSFVLEGGPLSARAAEVAKNELRETPEVKEAAIKELRALVENDPNIVFGTDDDLLTVFLRPCKFYPQSAFKLIQRFLNFRAKHANILKDLVPTDEEKAITEHNVVNLMPQRDHKGRRVLLVNVNGDWNTSEVNSDQLFRLFYLIHEAAFLEPETQVNGVACIMDFKGMGMKQVTSLSPSFSKMLLTFIQEAMPLRLQEVHMVFNPFVFNIVWKIFQPLIHEKLRGRIHIHKDDMKKLHAFIPPSHLPANYGGELPKIDYTSKDWYPVLKEHIEHYRKLNTYSIKK